METINGNLNGNINCYKTTNSDVINGFVKAAYYNENGQENSW